MEAEVREERECYAAALKMKEGGHGPKDAGNL